MFAWYRSGPYIGPSSRMEGSSVVVLSVVIKVTLSRADRVQLARLAKAEGMSMSAWIRRLVRRELDARRQPEGQ